MTRAKRRLCCHFDLVFLLVLQKKTLSIMTEFSRYRSVATTDQVIATTNTQSTDEKSPVLLYGTSTLLNARLILINLGIFTAI